MKKMNLILIFIVVFIFGCNPLVTKHEVIKLNINHTTIRWYYYTYFRSQGVDIVSVENEKKEVIIYEDEGELCNVYTKADTIIIKTKSTYYPLRKPIKVPKEVYSFKIILDTTASNDEYRFRPK